MATASPARRAVLGKLAATKRHTPDADTTDLEREYAALSIEDYIRKTVENAPPLTDAQRERLANLLRGGGQHR